ncbi:four-helix bundle copper-binding protein [bacterium]|nr:four-helix bundle copper-binding protein [bacterium]
MPHVAGHLDPKVQQCIDNCTKCHDVCLQTISYCLSKGGKHAELSHIRLLTNCAEICQTSANFMLTGSDFHQDICRACAELCERCAEDCEKFAQDAQMKNCADICRRCADSCRKMSGERKAA